MHQWLSEIGCDSFRNLQARGIWCPDRVIADVPELFPPASYVTDRGRQHDLLLPEFVLAKSYAPGFRGVRGPPSVPKGLYPLAEMMMYLVKDSNEFDKTRTNNMERY